jgi:hypothetical protein
MKKLLMPLLLVFILISGCIYQPATVPPVTPVGGQPVVTTFAVNPAIVTAGQNAVLGWVVTGAQTVSIDNGVGPVPLSGTKSIVPSATTTYTLIAVNPAGSSTVTVTVTVMGSLPVQQAGESTAILNIVPNESGSLVKSGANYARSEAVCAGDNPANQASRAFLSFDLTNLPPTAVVSEAVLDLTGYSVIGNPTYSSVNWGNMGALEIYQYQYGSAGSLGRITYEAPALMAGSLKLTDLQSGAPLLVDVTLDDRGDNMVEKLISSAQGRCQFRLGFFTSTNWDSKADLICLDGAVLKIRYSLP